MFHIYLLIIWVFIAWRLLLPLNLGAVPKYAIAGLLLVLMQHHLVSRLVFGNMFSPEVSFPVLASSAWAFGACVLLFAITVMSDGVLLIGRLFGLRLMAQQLNVLRLASLGLAVMGAAVGVSNALQVPGVTRVELAVTNLPRELEGLKVVQLSDLHISRLLPADWVASVVARTNALHPDLILITGDLIDGTVAARKADVAPLRSLQAPMGIFAIPGNHEYYFDEPAWKRAFTDLGMRVLSNEHVAVVAPEAIASNVPGNERVPRGPGTIVIAGINDLAAKAYGLPGPDVEAALQSVPSGHTVILLDHRPADVLAHAQRGVDVQLSGHTHGGMIRGFAAAVRWANGGYVSGLYQVAGMQLYVSNGTGIWNGFPMRLGVPPEITEFVLRARSPS